MHFFHSIHFRRHRRRHRDRVILVVGNFAVELIPEESIHMATEINVGQTLPLSIRYLDTTGQPMGTPPTPDAPPAWTQTTSADDTLTPATDGLSATALGLEAGSDVVNLTLAVGGVSFTATLDVTINAVVPVQTLGSIEIVAGTPTP